MGAALILATVFLLIGWILLILTLPTLWAIRDALRGRDRLRLARELSEWLFWLTIVIIIGTFLMLVLIYILWLARFASERMANVLMILTIVFYSLAVLILLALLLAAVVRISNIQGSGLLFTIALRLAEPALVNVFDSLIQVLVFQAFALFFGFVALIMFLL